MTEQGVSFWKRPEGKAGYLVGALLVGALAWFGVVVAPYLALALVNMYYLAALIVGGVVVVKFFTSATFWALFQIVSRQVASLVVDLDPVKIMEGFLAFAKSQRQKLVDAIGDVQAAEKNLAEQIRRNNNLVQQYRSQAQAGMQRYPDGTVPDDDLEVNGALENAASIENTNAELGQFREDLTLAVDDLKEACKRVDYEISTTQNSVNLERQRYAAAQAMGSAISKMRAVLDGGGRRELYDMASERTRTIYNQKRAVLTTLVETSRHAAGSIDLQRKALRNQGLAQLRQQIGGMKGEGLSLLTAGAPNFTAKAKVADESIASYIGKK